MGVSPRRRCPGPASSAPSTPTSASRRVRSQNINLRDGNVDGVSDSSDSGLSVRVVHDGTWGFAAGVALTPEAAAALAEQAVEVAKVSSR